MRMNGVHTRITKNRGMMSTAETQKGYDNLYCTPFTRGGSSARRPKTREALNAFKTRLQKVHLYHLYVKYVSDFNFTYRLDSGDSACMGDLLASADHCSMQQ